MADISKITTLDGQTYDLKDSIARSLKYGVCSTAADTASKEVTIDSVTELTAGLTIFVKFSNANTVANPTLKVNSLDAKAIKRYGTTAPSTSAESSWNAGAIAGLTYDGTYWILHDWNNTTYSAMSQSEMQTGTATTARNITAARLKEAILYHQTGEPNVQANWSETDDTSDAYIANKPSIPTKVSDLTNDSGFISSYTETDPTVPSWAKASSKPSYTASEVGAVPTARTVNGKALSSDITLDASDVGAYVKPSGGIPATDLASGVIPDDFFIATYDTTSYSDVYSAYSAGKIIICVKGSNQSLLSSYGASTFYFRTVISGSGIEQYRLETTGWYTGSFTIGTYSKPSGGIPASDLASGVIPTQLIYPVKGTQSSAPASWTGAISASALFDGLTIAYYLPYNSAANVTLNLTLSGGGTTGAIPVYINGSIRLGQQYGAGSMVYLTYWGANSIASGGTSITSARWITSVAAIYYNETANTYGTTVTIGGNYS